MVKRDRSGHSRHDKRGLREKPTREEVDRRLAAVALSQALAQPRLALYSPLSSAILNYLKSTTPRFSISKELAKLVEAELSKRYPVLASYMRRSLESRVRRRRAREV
ncbi:MAG: hypothetical protein NZ953_00510 [Thaumarchaeota archaeon]|nr:hypothetical protein [Candidatus Calditenuaceae archaeon]MCX8203797.1 hypothetical protein [Nitrososphaeria archaeon]MDW8043041.1 hypothetical protein [Nitrososphaerota archaeon]